MLEWTASGIPEDSASGDWSHRKNRPVTQRRLRFRPYGLRVKKCHFKFLQSERLDSAALFDRNRHLLDDLEPEAFQRGDVHGSVGEQANALNTKI